MEGLGDIDQDILSPTSIGVATLDTRIPFDPSTPFVEKIHTKLFHRGSFSKAHKLSQRRNNGRYLFSEREVFTKHTAFDVLKKALTHQGRDVILLSHSTENELDFMARMDFKPEEHARITNILDTGLIASGVLNGEKHTVTRVEKTLQHVLEELGFAGKEFHNAANDANFTLRALLLLILRAVQDARPNWTNHTPFRVLMLRQIALTPLPPTARSGRSPRRENMRPETAEANRAKKQARRKAGAEWEQELGSF